MTSSAFLLWLVFLARGGGSSSDWTILFFAALVVDVLFCIGTAAGGRNDPPHRMRRR